jgi:hypothetical protein
LADSGFELVRVEKKNNNKKKLDRPGQKLGLIRIPEPDPSKPGYQTIDFFLLGKFCCIQG